jgi:hypothetical protein
MSRFRPFQRERLPEGILSFDEIFLRNGPTRRAPVSAAAAAAAAAAAGGGGESILSGFLSCQSKRLRYSSSTSGVTILLC